jgi:hypothetical protein
VCVPKWIVLPGLEIVSAGAAPTWLQKLGSR